MTTQTLTARILIESDKNNSERVRTFVIGAYKQACKNLREGTVAIAIFDERDVMIGVDITGVPSEEFQDAMEALLDGKT